VDRPGILATEESAIPEAAATRTPATAINAPGSEKATLGGGTRGMAAVPSLRDMSQADAIAAATSQPHIIPKPEGGYVGAPDWVQSPADIAKMRADFDANVVQGVQGRDWYERARAFNTEVVGDKPIQASNEAEAQARFSPMAEVSSNTSFWLAARNAYESGYPAELIRDRAKAAGYNLSRDQFEAALTRGEVPEGSSLGLKTDPYRMNLDPNIPYAVTGVNDVWHMRAFGYRSPNEAGEMVPFDGTPSSQQHAFTDYETMLAVKRANDAGVGGFRDWTAARLQAAAWVSEKAQGLQQRFNLPWDEAMRRANSTYPDFALKSSVASSPHEQQPGAVTGLTEGNMTKEAFANAASWNDPITGGDRLLRDTGLLTPRSVPMTGAFEPAGGGIEYNPGMVGRSLIDRVPGTRDISPRTEAALTGAEAVRGLTDFQAGQPWHHVDTSAPAGEANSLKVTGPDGRVPTGEEMAALKQIADKEGLTLSNSADGVALLNLKGPEDEGFISGANMGKLLKARLQNEIEKAYPFATIERGKASGNYIDYENTITQALQGQGGATREMVRNLDEMRVQAPRMYEQLTNSPAVADKAAANLVRLRESGQLGVRPDYEEFLRLLVEGRLKGLLERTQSPLGYGGLPAAAGAVGLGAAAAGAGGSNRESP
jgi:hypothetical protein